MTVKVKHGKFRFALWIPQAFLGFGLNKFFKSKIKQAQKSGVEVQPIDKKEIKVIAKMMRQAKKYHGKLELVSVNSSDGTRVRITL